MTLSKRARASYHAESVTLQTLRVDQELTIIVIDRYQESQVSVDKFDFAAKELQAFFIDPQGHVRLMGTVIFHESLTE